MRAFFQTADDFLRGKGIFAIDAPLLGRLRWLLAFLLICGLLYGAVMGTYSGLKPGRLHQLLYSGVKVPFLLLATFGLVLLVLLHLLGSLMARLRGQVQIDISGPVPGFTTVSVRPRRVFDSASVGDIDLGSVRFRIQAKRYLLIFKRLKFMALAGSTILDKQALRPGGTRLLRARGQHEAIIMDDEGREIKVDIT